MPHSRVRQLIQHRCGGEHKHPAVESSRTGNGGCGRRNEGKFSVTETRQERLSAVRAGEGLTGCHGRGYKKLPPTKKVREHENVVLIRWGLAYIHRSEQLALSWGSRINRFANQIV